MNVVGKWAATMVLLGATACGEAGPDAALARQEAHAVGAPATAPVCSIAGAPQSLPEEVRESSGLAQSRRDPNVFWTHNDAGNTPDLFALDASGQLMRELRVTGAELTDWEDLAAAPCGSDHCLYIGDIGDNDAERESVTIYRVPEPEVSAAESAPAEALHARFPDGARDAEGLFVTLSGDVYLVTKGEVGPVELYRFPAPQQPGAVAALERVRELFPEAEHDDDRVTGASLSPDGRWVGIRSYRTLYLYPAAELLEGGAVEPVRVSLEPLGEPQGESLAITADGTIWMTSEAGGDDELPSWSRLECTFPAG